jgi:hypothetical protein
VVAVIPPEAELWLLEQVSDSGLDALERCLGTGMLEPHEHAVRFRHELARLILEAGDVLQDEREPALQQPGAWAGRSSDARRNSTRVTLPGS